MDYKSKYSRRKKMVLFFLLSLLFHALFLFVILPRIDRILPQKELAKKERIEIELVPNTKNEKVTTQVVETTHVQKSEKAAPKAYLGEQTQVVERQTKARTNAPFTEGKIGSTKTGSKASSQKQLKLSNLGVPMNFKPLGNLGPHQPGQSASTSDYLKDVPDSAETMLNTKEFMFFSFYQRVRKQLEQYWEPGLRERLKKMFDRGRQLSSDQENSTRLLVILNRTGAITKIQVEDTSGLIDLDQAAIDAFNKAGPFPNPPQGMIEKDGTVKVEWEFILKT